jgi:sRNA-binding carbon storage regulator CsrA
MLVVARKRHEAVIIDGNIRVEVLRLTPGVARLRCVAPRDVAIHRGVARAGAPAAVEAKSNGCHSNGAAIGVVDITLCDQQIITIGSDIHLGLIDVDRTRAVLFVDAPDGISVNVESASPARNHILPVRGESDDVVQALLPFSTAPEPAGDDDDQKHRPREPRTGVRGDGASDRPPSRILPFPGAGASGEDA